MSEPQDAGPSLSESVDSIYKERRKFGLRRRSVVAVSALVAFVLLAQAAVVAVLGHGRIVADARDRARSFATLAADPICDAYFTYFDSGTSKFRDLVRETVELNRDVLTLEIFDTEGRRLFAYDREHGERPPGSDGFFMNGELLQAIQGLDQVAWDSKQAFNDEIGFVVVQPHVEDWGRHRLSVVFGFGERFVQRAAIELSRWLAFLALIGLALGIACAYLLAGQSLRPLERLTRGARELSKGKLNHRIELKSGDEFEVLGTTLDHMAKLLSGTIRDLESSNRHLEAVNTELQELDKVKSDLLANVSHELRTPLTAISGYVEAMSAGLLGEVNQVQQDSLCVVDRNIHRLRSMIDQLLSYSRMDSGRIELEMRPFDLAAVVGHVGEAVQAAHGGKPSLEIRIEEPLPEAFGDAARISQVLENLLTNAAKFSSGKPIEVEASEVSEGVSVRVIDHGIGIPEDLRERIFDRFFQVDATARRQYGGMGLGLAIVKEILEMHHSGITVTETPGGGATFSFILARSTERTGLVPIQGGPRILLIDDDAQGVQRITGRLVAEGWTVLTAASGEQGSSLARRERPDAVLLDRLLPDMDGFDLLTRLSEDPRTHDIPVVLFTVRPERGLGLRLGAADYWVKPLEPEEIQARLELLLRVAKGGSPNLESAAQPKEEAEAAAEVESGAVSS